MKQYIISIAVAAVVSSIAGMTAPEKWSKYIRIITGLVIVLSIASPLFSIAGSDIFEEFELVPQIQREGGTEEFTKELVKELKSRIENDISERISKEFRQNNNACVEISVNDKGEIQGVNKITLYGDRIGEPAKKRLKEVYGCDEVIYGGAEKNTEKR